MIPGYIVVNGMGIGLHANTVYVWLTVQFGRMSSLMTHHILFVKKKNILLPKVRIFLNQNRNRFP